MRRYLFLLATLIGAHNLTLSQQWPARLLSISEANFTIPDTVCVNTPIQIQNNTQNGTSFYWNFCSGSLNATPTGNNFTSPNLSLPVFMDLLQDGNNHYAFVVNHTGSLARMDFGSSYLNNPTITDMGSFGGKIPPQAEGLEIRKEGNTWIGYLIGGQNSNSRLVKLNFGTNIASTPVATNLGNIGNLDFPVDLSIVQDAGNWYGFTVSADNSMVTRFSFGNSLNNTPVATSLGNIGNLSYPVGLFMIKDGSNFHMFITNRNSSSISRLDFSNNLANTPTGVNLGNPGNNFSLPRDINVIRDCERIFGFVTNEQGDKITRLDFSSILATPTTTNLGNVGNLDFPHSISEIYRSGDAINFFAPNVSSNSVSRLSFTNCNASSIPSYLGDTPPVYEYTEPGEYNISLFVDEGTPTQDVLCKKIVVVGIPDVQTIDDISVCPGESVQLNTTGATHFTWTPSGGLSDPTIASPFAAPSSTTEYFVTGHIFSGCANIDSVTITVFPALNYSLTPDTSICSNIPLQLLANGGTSVTWAANNSLSDPNIPNPIASPTANTTYYVTFTDANNCSVLDSVFVEVRQDPVFTLSPGTAICEGDTTLLVAGGGHTYSWSPSVLDNPQPFEASVNPAATTIYTVNITDTVCHVSDLLSTTITVHSLPTITAQKSNDIDCTTGFAGLSANGAASYAWSPADGLSDAFIANPTASPPATTSYTVTGTDMNGCVNNATITVAVSQGNKIPLYLPNAFTPNNDGLNDCFGLKYSGLNDKLEFSIYNRWGERIFFTNNPQECWDGYYKGVAQEIGVYVYMIRREGPCGSEFEKGLFTLIR